LSAIFYLFDSASFSPSDINIPPVILSNQTFILQFFLIFSDNFEANNANIKHQIVPVNKNVNPRIKKGIGLCA